MNPHHPSSNSQTTPKNNNHLLEILEKGDMDLVNTSAKTTTNYCTGKGTSIIDLALTAPHITAEISNWAVEDSPGTGSDHEMLKFDITSNNIELVEIPTSQRCNWNKAEWTHFQEQRKQNTAEDTEA